VTSHYHHPAELYLAHNDTCQMVQMPIISILNTWFHN